MAPCAQTATSEIQAGDIMYNDENICYHIRGVVVPGRHLTPASSKWLQLWFPIPFEGQLTSLLSVPRQPTLSRRMGPVPWPKRAKEKAVAPTGASTYTKSIMCTDCTINLGWTNQLESILVVCRQH